MLMEQGAHPERPRLARRSARQIRLRIVARARAYRAAAEACEQAWADVEQGEGALDVWEHAAEAMDQARNALFSALDELDMEEGRA